MANYEFDFTPVTSGFDTSTAGLAELVQLIDNLSVDEVVADYSSAAFSADATTYLYSGRITINGIEIPAGTIANAFEGSRTLDKSVAANFLQSNDYRILLKRVLENDIRNGTLDLSKVMGGLRSVDEKNELSRLVSKTTLTDAEFFDAVRLASNGFSYKPTKGAWAIISENFVEATPITSRVECIASEADTARTWGPVEVPTALDKLPDNQIFGDKTTGEWKLLRVEATEGDPKGLNQIHEKDGTWALPILNLNLIILLSSTLTKDA